MQPADDRFERLYSRHYGEVLAYALRRAPRPVAQDVVAETFLVAWRRLEEVPEPALPWLLGTARKTLANQRRSSRRQRVVAERLAAEPAAEAVEDVDRPPILAALARLPERDREALMLAAWEELDSRSASRVLGCTATAYRLRLHRARRKLERVLVELEGFETRGPAQGARLEERC